MALRRLKTAGFRLAFVVISILPSGAETQGDPNAGKSFPTDLAQACARGLLSQSICEAARGGSPQAPASSGAGSGSNFPSQGSGSMASGITNSGSSLSGISFTPLLPPTASNPGHGLVPMSQQTGYRGPNSGYSQPISGSSNAQGSYSGINTPNTGNSNPSSGFGSPGFGQQQSMMPQGDLSSSGNVVPYQLPAQSASSNPAGASGGFNINPGVPSSIGDTFPRGGYSNTNVGYGNGMSSGQSSGAAGGYSTGQRTQQAGAYSNGNGYGPNTYAAGNANPNGYGTAYTPMPLNNGGNSYYRNTGSASFSSQLALFALLAAPKLILPFFASGR